MDLTDTKPEGEHMPSKWKLEVVDPTSGGYVEVGKVNTTRAGAVAAANAATETTGTKTYAAPRDAVFVTNPTTSR